MNKVKLKMPPSSSSASCCSNTGGSAGGCEYNSKCGPIIQMKYSKGAPWVSGSISTAAGDIQQVSASLIFSDILGSIKARFGIGRDNYKVEPGIYCIGNPDGTSPVLVTANYKMTFDSLRMELSELNAWLLVLDTKGINVWCAAGKGTFGTKELVNRIAKVSLGTIVSHRTLILPQLGAPGVSAHEVTKRSGFKVVYGPVRASDIKAFLQKNMIADSGMRTVRFTMVDRLVLTPLEFVNTFKQLLILFGVLFILNLTVPEHFGTVDFYAILGAVFVGTVLTPVLLPFIPGRAFSFKGWLLGLIWAAGVLLLNGFPDAPVFSWVTAASYLLALPAVSSYLAMNFTGCSTYTSFSGVKREMEIALPLMLVSLGLGILLQLAGLIFRL